jgi:hypothetical protein
VFPLFTLTQFIPTQHDLGSWSFAYCLFIIYLVDLRYPSRTLFIYSISQQDQSLPRHDSRYRSGTDPIYSTGLALTTYLDLGANAISLASTCIRRSPSSISTTARHQPRLGVLRSSIPNPTLAQDGISISFQYG